MSTLTQTRLHELLDYDPETGVFTNRTARGTNALRGAVAGCIHPTLGYVLIGLEGTRYYAHRLAWLWMTGKWPLHLVDHRNGIEHDNRWANLREATRRENGQNQKAASTQSSSGHVGVGWHAQRSKWRAFIGDSGRTVHLGLFDTKEEAITAYLAAKAEIHTFQPTPRDA